MSTRNCRAGISMSQADEEIRGLEMLRRDTEAAVAAISKDPWQQWLLHHGFDVIVAADLNEWEKACLKCIVRHSGYSGVIPQEWLFDGGPDGDPILEELSCLPKDTRRKRITRLVNKIDKLCRETMSISTSKPATHQHSKPTTAVGGCMSKESCSSVLIARESSVCGGCSGSAGGFCSCFAGQHFGRF